MRGFGEVEISLFGFSRQPCGSCCAGSDMDKLACAVAILDLPQPWQGVVCSSCLSCTVPGDGALSGTRQPRWYVGRYRTWWVLAAPAHWVLRRCYRRGSTGASVGYGESPCSLATFSPTYAPAGEKRTKEFCLLHAPRPEGPEWIMFKVTVGGPT